jgi:hypothetical protein
MLSCPLKHLWSIGEGDHVIAFNAKGTLINLKFLCLVWAAYKTYDPILVVRFALIGYLAILGY